MRRSTKYLTDLEALSFLAGSRMCMESQVLYNVCKMYGVRLGSLERIGLF